MPHTGSRCVRGLAVVGAIPCFGSLVNAGFASCGARTSAAAHRTGAPSRVELTGRSCQCGTMARRKAPLSRSTRWIVSPSAAVRLVAAREWLATLPRDAEALILAPHTHAADALLHADAAGSGARFGLLRFTPVRLAARLAAPELA